MLKIIQNPEDLWREVAKFSKNPRVIEGELFSESDEHFVLAYGPVAQRNQFQSLLYSASERFNVSILPIHKLDLCGDIPWPGKVVCHFHWLHDGTKIAKTEAEADRAVRYWESTIKKIKQNGYKIVWTVHNVMPHESYWVDQDKKIHQMMADAADSLHVMASDSAQLTKPYYTLDESKMFFVPHPTYEGAQLDEVSREEARAQLHIGEEDFVFLSFGAVMGYKGYDRLMNAYDRLRSERDGRIRLIIAGLPSDEALVKRIMAWGEGKSDVILDMTKVPNDRLQVYFRSADLAVCPYRRTMNSGAAMMAITFDVPVLGPNSGGFLDIEASGCGVTFDNSRDTELYEKMRILADNKAMSLEELMKTKQGLAASEVSESFFENMKRVVS